MAKKDKNKRPNISINTGEPIEEKEIDLNPLVPLPDGDEEEDDEELELDEEEADPFGDRWEK